MTTRSQHDWRSPYPDEPQEEGAVCNRCGAFANSEAAQACVPQVSRLNGKGRRTAIVTISTELLLSVLHLPQDTEIVCCRDGSINGYGLGSIVLRVEHPDLRFVPEGCIVPDSHPMFKSVGCDSVTFDGWGQ